MRGDILAEVSDSLGFQIINGSCDLRKIFFPNRHSCRLEDMPISLLTLAQFRVGALVLDNFLSELFVHSCKLSGPFEDSLLKLLCGPLLLAQETRLLQPNPRLVRCYS